MCVCMYVLHLMYTCIHRIYNVMHVCSASDVFMSANISITPMYVSYVCVYVCIASGVGGVRFGGLSVPLIWRAGIYKCLFPAQSTSAHALCRHCVSCICFSHASLCLLVSTFYIPLCMFAKLFRSSVPFTRCVSFAMFVLFSVCTGSTSGSVLCLLCKFRIAIWF